MPLTQGRILGYDSAQMTFGFTMLNGGDEVVFQISAAAIDKLVGGPRGRHVDRQIQFSLLRETIENLASARFYASTFVRGGALRIFAKDIGKQAEASKVPKNRSLRPASLEAGSRSVCR